MNKELNVYINSELFNYPINSVTISDITQTELDPERGHNSTSFRTIVIDYDEDFVEPNSIKVISDSAITIEENEECIDIYLSSTESE